MLPDIDVPEMETSPSTSAIPHNREAEEAVVGSVLINPDIYPELKDVKPDDFYIIRNRWIWESFACLQSACTPIDFLTVSTELERTNRLGEIGGPAYLTALLNQTPTSMHANAYAEQVKECSLRRRMLTGANVIATAAYNQEFHSDELLAETSKQAQEIQSFAPSNIMVSAGSAASVMYDILDETARSGKPPSIPTGFYDLDRILQGLYDDTVYIFATRPGLGKSTCLLDIARHAAIKRNKHVAIFSLEMSTTQVIRRLIAGEYGISSENIKSGRLEDAEWPLVTHGIEASQDWPITIDPTPGITIETLAARASVLKTRGQCDLLIIDYVQLIQSVPTWGGSKNRSRQQEIGYITRYLKKISKDLHIPVLSAAQVNRNVDARSEKRLYLSDLRESGDIEQDADVVVFVQPPDDGQPINSPIQTIEVAKHREGATGECQLVMRRKYPRFESIHPESDNQDWWTK
jgi:replicative DNA helicase